MTIRTFWILFIKILGIFMSINIIPLIPSLISVFFNLKEVDEVGIGILILTFSFYILVLFIALRKYNWIIDILKLDKNFDSDKIEIDFKLSSLLRISIIVTGFLLLINNLPEFLKRSLMMFHQQAANIETDIMELTIFHGLKTLLGLVFLVYNRIVVKIFKFEEQ